MLENLDSEKQGYNEIVKKENDKMLTYTREIIKKIRENITELKGIKR